LKPILRGKLAGILLLKLLHIRRIRIGEEAVAVGGREDDALLLLLLSQQVLIWIVGRREWLVSGLGLSAGLLEHRFTIVRAGHLKAAPVVKS
jgi:hypothetical protein